MFSRATPRNGCPASAATILLRRPRRSAQCLSRSSRRRSAPRWIGRKPQATLLGGGGWLVVRDVQATIAEHDLSRIGNGIPTIVQIHDPQCSQCIQLQKNTRSALEGFPDNDLQFLVANIKDARGRRLATEHSVGHVTLILFDADGKRRDILRGPNTIQSLEERFRRFHKESHRN